MPKGSNQKFKLYRLAQIMQEQTDDEHYITMPEIDVYKRQSRARKRYGQYHGKSGNRSYRFIYQ